MKTDIHPKYFNEAKVTCSCGNSFTIGSTQEKIEVEVCSACHPFYTGNEKVMDTAGRVEKFKARSAAALKAKADKAEAAKKARAATKAKTPKAKKEEKKDAEA